MGREGEGWLCGEGWLRSCLKCHTYSYDFSSPENCI